LPFSDITDELPDSSEFEEPAGSDNSASDEEQEPANRGGGKDLELL